MNKYHLQQSITARAIVTTNTTIDPKRKTKDSGYSHQKQKCKHKHTLKPKKLKKYWKAGEVFEKGILWDVRNIIKRHLKKRTCRWIKHKKNLLNKD